MDFPMSQPLSDAERTDALARLPAWTYDAVRVALHRQITLADFPATFALMTRIAFEAEKADHHPEWTNVYNRIDIWLTTHDAGGVSPRDVAMAEVIDRLADAAERAASS
jgi:4a-hydroxytetrahydrobiopterin dehydratase